MAYFAGAAVGADKVLGRHVVGTVRPVDMNCDAFVLLIETGHGVTPANFRVVSLGPLAKRFNEPLLLNRHDEELGVR